MIPVLYEAGETEFKSNGLGRPMFTKCTVSETLNGEYELSAELPVTDKHFKDIKQERILLASTELGTKDPQPFEIYDIEKNIDGTVSIKAQHISYRLSQIPVMPFTSKNPQDTFAKIKQNSVVANPFTFYTDVTDIPADASLKVEVPTSARSLFSDDETKGMLGVFKSGEYKYDRFKVSLLERRGIDTNIILRYGKDISTLTQDENIEDTVTSLLPYTKKTENDNTSVTTLTPPVWDSEYVNKYKHKRIEIVDLSSEFDNDTTVTQDALLAKTKEYAKVNRIGIPKLSITVDMVALWQTASYDLAASMQTLHMGDTVYVVIPFLDIKVTGEVIKYEWDVLTDTYSKLTIGNTVDDIVQTIRNITRNTADLTPKKSDSSKNKDKSANARVVIEKAGTSYLLVKDISLDALFGLKPNTCNGTNTVVNFTNVDGSNMSNFRHESDGWYGDSASYLASTDLPKEVIIGYSAHFYGSTT